MQPLRQSRDDSLPFCRWLAAGVIACLVLFSQATSGAADEAATRDFFEKRIRPRLIQHCYECHSAAAKESKGGLRLDFRAGWQAGGENGPAVVPGKPGESLLLQALQHEGLEMPPGKKLPLPVIADFVAWIEQGAFDPRDDPLDSATAVQLVRELNWTERRQWWSLEPLSCSVPPKLRDARSVSTPIDAFVLQRLEERELQFAAPAARQSLARRMGFSLTGLPVATDEMASFVTDEQVDACERWVDRWLASPHYGEHWARHWMDVVRYTDTYGYEWDIPAKGAWRYRDYLIRAFNSDLPYDQFVREQIAGDLLESPRCNHQLGINESLAGVMFHQLGEKRHGDSAEFNGIHQEMLDNKIDAFSKTFQSLTIAVCKEKLFPR